MKKPLAIGDYVLGTKYKDGSPMDPFAIGFLSEINNHTNLKYVIISGNKSLECGRCERISMATGAALVRVTPLISDIPGHSLWYWRKNAKRLADKPN
jgi:hypothetical protein